MTDDLRRRVEAVERAVTGGEPDVAGVADAATLDARLTDAEARLDELSTRVEELDATTQALRGYLGGVDTLSADVERRADLALAKAEALETAVFDDPEEGLVVERLRQDTPTTTADGTDTTAVVAGDTDTTAAVADAAPDGSSSAHIPPHADEAADATTNLFERLRDAL